MTSKVEDVSVTAVLGRREIDALDAAIVRILRTLGALENWKSAES